MFSFKKEEVVPVAASPRSLQSALSSGIAKQKEHSNVGSPAFNPSSGLSVVSTPQPPADSAPGDGYLVSHVSKSYTSPLIPIYNLTHPLPPPPPLSSVPFLNYCNSLPFSTHQVIKSVIAKYQQTFAKSGAESGDDGRAKLRSTDPEGYYLMVADDDGHVDDDFPEIDPNVPISSVGVDKFVLCERETESPVLRLCIPEAALDIQRIIKEAGPAAELSVSVSQPMLGGRASSVPTSSYLASVPEEESGDFFDKRGKGGIRRGVVQQGGADAAGVFLHITLKASNSMSFSGVPSKSDAFVL